MAEELLMKLGGDRFEAESAGFDPTVLNPYVVTVMKEEGIDLSSKMTKSVGNLIRAQNFYGFVITVCNRARETDCPVFPGVPIRLHWDLENPEDFTGTDEEILEKVRQLKDRIKQLIIDFIKEHAPS
jgi:arsenate reductase